MTLKLCSDRNEMAEAAWRRLFQAATTYDGSENGSQVGPDFGIPPLANPETRTASARSGRVVNQSSQNQKSLIAQGSVPAKPSIQRLTVLAVLGITAGIAAIFDLSLVDRLLGPHQTVV
jgi:hypothetical protein